MADTLLPQMLTELEAALNFARPRLEGFRDFAQLTDGQTQEEAAQAIADYERREALINDAIRTLVALQDDNYPIVKKRTVRESARKQFQENVDTVLAAMGEIEPDIASNLDVASAVIESKGRP